MGTDDKGEQLRACQAYTAQLEAAVDRALYLIRRDDYYDYYERIENILEAALRGRYEVGD